MLLISMNLAMVAPTQKNIASIDYNRNIELQTVRWAMIDWLDDKHRGGLWEDVIVSHFTIRNDNIRKNIYNWAASNPQMKTYRGGTTNGLYGYRPQPQNVYSASSLNLLDEYDKGIARIRNWRNES